MSEPRERSGVYVYGFVRAEADVSCDSPGIDGASKVCVLGLGEVAAVTSPIDLEEILGTAGEASPDLEWIAPRAIRHEVVVEEAMQHSPILPLTFGVIFSSQEALAEAIEGRSGRIAAFLDFAADREEWSVKVFADDPGLRRYVEGAPAFRTLKEALPDSPGARYLHLKRLDRELARQVREARLEMVEAIRRSLEGQGIESKPLKLSSQKLTGRQDEMVLNTALLPRSEEVEPLLERIRGLAEDYRARGLIVEASGPWPPYHFCPNLEVS